MQTNYRDEKGNIRKELLNEDAEKIANKLIVKRYDRKKTTRGRGRKKIGHRNAAP